MSHGPPIRLSPSRPPPPALLIAGGAEAGRCREPRVEAGRRAQRLGGALLEDDQGDDAARD
eukprot:7337437-Pyramimonas_sp.AAC.1